MDVEYKKVLMMPGYTISAIIRRENRHDMSIEEVKDLMVYYNLRNDFKIPRAGDIVEIPIKKEKASSKKMPF